MCEIFRNSINTTTFDLLKFSYIKIINMKKVGIALVLLAFIGLPFCVKAQEEKIEKKEIEVITTDKGKADSRETEEIIIRNKGEKDINLKVEINGDKITVNGKPLAEFKDDKIVINKRKMIIRNGDEMMAFNMPGAIPFSEDLMRQWKDGGGQTVIKPFLGVTTEKVTEGAKIMELVKESAAEKAGLKEGDIITKVGDDIVKDGESLSSIIANKKPKDVVKVTYLRNGKESSVKATLGERKVQSEMTFNFKRPRVDVRQFSAPGTLGVPYGDIMNEETLDELRSMEPGSGFKTTPFTQFDKAFPRQKRLGLKIQDTEEGGNVKVIDVEAGSAAEKAGLKKDDIITEIAGKKIENTDDAREQLTSEGKTGYTIKAKRSGKDMSFEVKIPKKLKTANL